jgi:hypothetical protein
MAREENFSVSVRARAVPVADAFREDEVPPGCELVSLSAPVSTPFVSSPTSTDTGIPAMPLSLFPLLMLSRRLLPEAEAPLGGSPDALLLLVPFVLPLLSPNVTW